MAASAASASTTAIDYTLTTERTSGQTCESPSDCAAEFDTQLFRGDCLAGACEFIVDQASGQRGDLCDSPRDCGTGYCSLFSFTSAADERAMCTSRCGADSECLAGEVCTDYLIENICVAPCAADSDCAVLLGTPPQDTPWTHLVCEVETGHCQFP